MEINGIEFTSIRNNTNGNPRYVAHYLNFLTEEESEKRVTLASEYDCAVYRCKAFGGKRFHNKQYGGGIVFCTYDLEGLVNRIQQKIKEDNEKQKVDCMV